MLTSEFPPGPGGIGNHAYNLALQLTSNNYDVTVWAPATTTNPENELAFDQSTSFKIHRFHKKSSPVFTYLSLIRAISGSIPRNTKATLIASGRMALIIGGVLSMQRSKFPKSLVVVHGLDINPASARLKGIVNRALSKFNKIVAVSGYTRSHLDEKHLYKTQVINNGVNVKAKEYSNQPPVKLPGSPSLITVGTLWERKGQFNVVSALPEIIKKYPDVHYHVVGLPEEAHQLKQLADKLQVSKYITIHGTVSNQRLAELLSGADIFIMLSSRTKSGDFEGFGIAILEANLFGKPAIGSNNCGITDAIKNYNTGILIDPESAVDCTKAISDILENYNEYSESARQYAEQNSWENTIKKYLEVINS